MRIFLWILGKLVRLAMIVVIALILLVVAFFFFFPNYRDYANKHFKPLQLRAVVVDKGKEETGCFGWISYRQERGIDTITNLYYCGTSETEIWNYVQPGDSLIKEEKTLEIRIARNGTTIKKIFPDETPL